MDETRFENITVAPAPHISRPVWTYQVMIDVIIGLVLPMAAAGYYFRLRALILISTCVISCVITEWVCNLILRRPNSLGDFSAIVTGIILALSLPPGLPVWAAVIGSVVSIAVGKMVFGGLGSNIFNPAMVGRTFLTASFGLLMTTWMVPAPIDSAMPDIAPGNMLHAKTQATPLGWSKIAIKDKNGAKLFNEEQFISTVKGDVGGCLGETSAIALIIGGLYLLIRRTINVHIPLAVLLSAFIFAGIAYLIDSDAYMEPLFHLTSGGLLLCAFFIATDPVTAPLTRRGMWIFGAGVGTITMLIRIVGAYPEGVMFSVLLMNAVTPLIDRVCKRVPAGGKPGV
jgi:electron transport complex protein RnfD